MIANGTATLEVERKVAGRVTSRDVGSKRLKEVEVSEQHAQAKVDLSYTKNLGNYESLRVGVSISLPCEADAVDGTVEEAKGLAETYLNKFLNEALEPKKAVGW